MATQTPPVEPRLEAQPAQPSAEERPTVLAIVVTHDGSTWLRDCLITLNAQSYPNMDVLVVDDASTELAKGAVRRVAKRHLRQRRWAYLKTARPLGYGGAINWALSRMKTSASYLLFLHDDTALEPDVVEMLIARATDDPATAVVGPKIVAWDDVARLEEVGMAADRFGYPYKGLEEGEIDLGQHDSSVETFYVTTTCMLVRHDVFQRLRGFDATMRAYSEDLDLCWRARLAGYIVRVEPRARIRHAIAMARGDRNTPFVPSRYFIRRNRLRTVLKNASGFRLLLLTPTFFLLAFVEMLAFIVLRQPREVGGIARGLGWNLVRVPQTLAERTRVQSSRKISDRQLRRLTVRQSTRLRAYVSHQTERLEEAWGRRAEVVAKRTSQARMFTSKFNGRLAVSAAFLLVAFLLGFRHFLWAPQSAVGELLPYPDRITALWRAYFSPWQSVGLGQPGPAPPALIPLGFMPLLTLGAVGAAQKLLVIGLGVVAFIGAYKLMGEVVDRIARVVAGFVYALGAVGYSALQHGDLGTMFFGSAAPFALLFLFRISGWVRPPGWNRNRAIARLAVVAGISGAFVPGALLLYGAIAVLLSLSRLILVRGAKVAKGLASSLLALMLSWMLLLPWSSTWFSPGGPLARLRSDDEWRTFASTFHGHGVASVLTGQTPNAPALFGLALPLLGIVAVVVSVGQRRRVALGLWMLILGVGWMITATANGWIRPLFASPTEAGVLASVCFAGLAAIAFSAFRLDLPRRDLGWFHAGALGAMALAVFLLGAGLLPAMWHGRWAPETASRFGPEIVGQVNSVLQAEATEVGQFRALWVGRGWSPVEPTVARPAGDYFLTGPRGQVLSDLFERDTGDGQKVFDRVVASITEGSTDNGGKLLSAFNIRYVVLERGPGAYRWVSQRDLALSRSDRNYLLLRNLSEVPRAAVYTEVPGFIESIAEADTSLATEQTGIQRVAASQTDPAKYTAERVNGPGAVFLAENHDPDWDARVGDTELQETNGGWGNAFTIPEGVHGDLVIHYRLKTTQVLWFLALGLGWVVALGAAFSRRVLVTLDEEDGP